MNPNKVLIIEDEPDLARLFENAFVTRGYKVRIARTGKSGLLAAKSFRPDAIILDRILPDMDGRDVCRVLQDGRPVPILFVTGRRGDPACKLCDYCSAYSLDKPMAMSDLLERVAALMRDNTLTPIP